jgi:single-strand DNA-binding protein
MLNRAEIIGHVGRVPELRQTPSGASVCDFSVATNVTWTDKQTGERRERTTWFRVTCWNRLAETISRYVYKGMLVRVEGEIDASAWLDQDGAARASLELTARDVKFLSRRDDIPRPDNNYQQSAVSGGSRRPQNTNGNGSPAPQNGNGYQPADIGDIPF